MALGVHFTLSHFLVALVPSLMLLTILPLAFLIVSLIALACGLNLSVMRYLRLMAQPFLPLAALPEVSGPLVSIFVVQIPVLLALPFLSKALYW